MNDKIFGESGNNIVVEANSVWECEALQLTINCNDQGEEICYITVDGVSYPVSTGIIQTRMFIDIGDNDSGHSIIGDGTFRVSWSRKAIYLVIDTVYKDESEIGKALYPVLKENQGKLLIIKRQS